MLIYTMRTNFIGNYIDFKIINTLGGEVLSQISDVNIHPVARFPNVVVKFGVVLEGFDYPSWIAVGITLFIFYFVYW